MFKKVIIIILIMCMNDLVFFLVQIARDKFLIKNTET
jgi:hypothetical protein